MHDYGGMCVIEKEYLVMDSKKAGAFESKKSTALLRLIA